jgi:chitin-binding protein
VAVGLLAMGQVNIYAWEPHANDLDTAIRSGDFGGYFSKITTWLNQKTPAESNRISEEAMKAILKDPVFRNTLNQRQLISKHGVDNLKAFAQADQSNKAFLAWLLRNTEALDLYLEGVVPTGIAAREKNSYTLSAATLDIWRKILNADPDSKEGIYLKLAIATAVAPPGSGAPGAGQAKTPAGPVDRYKHFKSAHKNKELFPSFDHLSVWEYTKVVSSGASDNDLAWAREMINSWRPDLRVNELVVNSTSEVWRRNSPIPYDNSYKNVLAGGGKCGPRSSWSVMICQAFGVPAMLALRIRRMILLCNRSPAVPGRSPMVADGRYRSSKGCRALTFLRELKSGRAWRNSRRLSIYGGLHQRLRPKNKPTRSWE